jgi:hypothetical protein
MAPVVAGDEARGCREPTVVNGDGPESWTAGLRGELATQFPIALCDNRGGLKGFGLFDFINRSAGDEIMGLVGNEGREKPKGVGVDGELREFSTAFNTGRRGEEGISDAITKAFSELPTLDTEGRLESESRSSQMSCILALALASAALDGAIHPLLVAFMKPFIKSGPFKLVEAG